VWDQATGDLAGAADAAAAAKALTALEQAVDRACGALRTLEGCLTALSAGQARQQLLEARGELESALEEWRHAVIGAPPEELCDRIRELSESALDVQRELAQERGRMRYRPADYDQGQIDWLIAALAESERLAPDAWRIVYFHHPLYTTIRNHCEGADVQGVRANLTPILRDRVHLVLTGHSHAFEWVRSSALPHTGLFVTGGGGQVSLRSSILSPRYFNRYRDRYKALRDAGAVECVTAGRGPAGPDGETGSLYHYLRVEVTPEALRVRPVGVRRLRNGYRREEPMPVHHVPELPPESDAAARPEWLPRRLEAVEIRRDKPPRLLWG
jgi:hypothetical protein